jgi:hypothetical protein
MQTAIIPILPYTVYNFGGLLSTTEEIVVADNVPVSAFTKIGLSLRQHKKNLAAGHSFTFIIRAINPSDADGQDFAITATSVGSTAAITGTGGAALLELTAGLVTLGSHPMVRVVLQVVAGSGTGAIFGIFSGDLLLKAE